MSVKNALTTKTTAIAPFLGQNNSKGQTQSGNNIRLITNRATYLIVSLFTLLAGMLIYLLFRDVNNMLLFSWIPKPEFLGTILIPLKPSIFSNILRYNLPDMLWFISAILFLRFIWFYRIKVQTVYIWCFYGIAAIFEISQLSKNVPGTFDWLDLFFMGIAALLEGLLYKFFISKEKLYENLETIWNLGNNRRCFCPYRL